MISDYSFGRIVVEGKVYNDDIKIVAGRLVPDWWRKRGHSVDLEDVQDILEARPDILVIGKGQPGYMRTTRALRDYLEAHGITLVEVPTAEAVRTFNRLFNEGKQVAGGFHVTC